MPAAGPGDFLALGELIEPLQTGQNANGVCTPPAVVIRGGLLWEATGSSDLPPGDRVGSRGMRVASTFRWRHPGACNQDWEDVGGVPSVWQLHIAWRLLEGFRIRPQGLKFQCCHLREEINQVT